MKLSLLADNPQEKINIAQWYFDEWLHIIPGMTVERISQKLSQSDNRSKAPLMILAHKNGQLAGVVELKFRENAHYPEYEHWLGGLFVNPLNRGQGISRSLIDEVKKHAAQFGVTKLYLQCETKNIDLYLQNNFSFLHTAKHGKKLVSIMLFKIDI